MATYHKAQHDFFGSNASFALPYLAKSPFRDYAIGDLSVHVASELLRAGSAYLSLFRRMRLVNVKSEHSHFSYGTIDPQLHQFGHLVFTFAFGRVTEFPSAERLVKRPLNNKVTIYGTQEDQLQFISVIVSSQIVGRNGVANLQQRSLKYLYMACGIVLRSIFRRFSRVDLDQDAIQTYHAHMTRQTVGQMPLGNVFQIPYERWTWQRSVWRLCPNLIASRCLNPFSATRVLDVLPHADIDAKNAAVDLIWSTSDNSLFDMVKRSLIRFLVAVDTQDVSVPDQTGLLFPALLYSLVFRGEVGYAPEIITVYPDMVAAFNERDDKLTSLFQPYDVTVRRMLEGDSKIVQKFVEAIDIFER